MKTKKIKLVRETLRSLTPEQLERVFGNGFSRISPPNGGTNTATQACNDTMQDCSGPK